MEYNPEKREIILDGKVLNELDKFVIDFINILEKFKDYVIVSGYVSILLGRTRATEDVDLLVPEIKFAEFGKLFKELINSGYECANTMNVNEAYEMLDDFAVRFFKKGAPRPNIEFKIIKTDLDKYSFENRIKARLREKTLFISPLEMQIAYKLFLAADGNFEELSSDKDIEDAKHLYLLFKDKINKEELSALLKRLKIENKMKWIEDES
ncbi:hypothetical protein HYT25_01390 [Candidatus Pacearchaeota archaeon]|nr:hypothetical protein [Candidatus Pacearchaeota archaeon]